MKEKLVKLMKSIGLLLVVGAVVAISVRLFTIVRVISSNELMNRSLLPETYIENVYREGTMGIWKKGINELRGRIDASKRLIQKLEKKSSPQQLQEVLMVKGEVREFEGEVDELNELFQQLQKRSRFPRSEIDEWQTKENLLFGELSEIQARIQKLEKETSTPDDAPQEKKPE